MLGATVTLKVLVPDTDAQLAIVPEESLTW